jgi:hypothetical protein
VLLVDAKFYCLHQNGANAKCLTNLIKNLSTMSMFSDISLQGQPKRSSVLHDFWWRFANWFLAFYLVSAMKTQGCLTRSISKSHILIDSGLELHIKSKFIQYVRRNKKFTIYGIKPRTLVFVVRSHNHCNTKIGKWMNVSTHSQLMCAFCISFYWKK